MSILDSITTLAPSAPRFTLYGRPGIGKSTLAASFPNPLFLLTENPEVQGIQALPVATSFEEIWKNTTALLKEELPFKTIVLDNISDLDNLVVDHILNKEPERKDGSKPTTLAAACGGYGAGYQRAALMHGAFKGLLDKFQERGITVIYVAHLSHSTIKPPDNEDYTAWTITMNHEKSREPYINRVDAVLYCKQKEHLVSTESGRALIKTLDDRIVVTGMDGCNISKNRFNMPKELPMSYGDIAKYIPFYNNHKETNK